MNLDKTTQILLDECKALVCRSTSERELLQTLVELIYTAGKADAFTELHETVEEVFK